MSAPHGQPADVVTELRLLVDAVLERVEPWLRAAARQADDPAHTEAGCGWCPLCALVATVRGDRPELTRRLAEQGSTVLEAVRTLLEQPSTPAAATPSGPAPSGPVQPEPVPSEPAPPRVQHIPVRRSGSPA